jgi:hypothetical protein
MDTLLLNVAWNPDELADKCIVPLLTKRALSLVNAGVMTFSTWKDVKQEFSDAQATYIADIMKLVPIPEPGGEARRELEVSLNFCMQATSALQPMKKACMELSQREKARGEYDNREPPQTRLNRLDSSGSPLFLMEYFIAEVVEEGWEVIGRMRKIKQQELVAGTLDPEATALKKQAIASMARSAPTTPKNAPAAPKGLI